MEEINSKKEENPKPKRRSKPICRITSDHVHYPPTRRTKPTRPSHAPSPNLKAPRYGKCKKNQSASMGTTAYDGCGEFVASISGEDCAACGCNRSFHREEEEEQSEESILEKCIRSGTIDESVLEMLEITSDQFRQIFCSPYGDKGEEDLVVEKEEERVKRLKTKFTVEQTEKMRCYAEKILWKVRPENREEVDGFCVEIGVDRKRFMIWINNHRDKN
ncbi:hypothetical protein AALP_AA6G162200 [Arabis alpina]|uniref:ZF-HD dimerization-type domain-containing protein n=1 Tax=Arabis alpina TaxID=50452 RepID=A0A087GPL3_ARAAL|nr:hypothetical protein AALP_AA6G162200 [Arabis alpina]